MFGTLIVFLKELFEKVNFEKNLADDVCVFWRIYNMHESFQD